MHTLFVIAGVARVGFANTIYTAMLRQTLDQRWTRRAAAEQWLEKIQLGLVHPHAHTAHPLTTQQAKMGARGTGTYVRATTTMHAWAAAGLS